MGIQGLWDAVAAAGFAARVEALAGKKCAIDASFWISHCMASGVNLKKGNDIIGVFFLRICYLLENRIMPIFVFDGKTPAAKTRTLLRRKLLQERNYSNHKLLAFKLLALQLKKKIGSVSNTSVGSKNISKLVNFEETITDKDEIPNLGNEANPGLCKKCADGGTLESFSDGDRISINFQSDSSEIFSVNSVAAKDDDAKSYTVPAKDFKILCMPESYEAPRCPSNIVPFTGKSTLEFGTNKFLGSPKVDDFIPECMMKDDSKFIGEDTSNMIGDMQLKLGKEMSKECYEKLPNEVKYQIMNQIRDSWRCDDRLRSLKMKGSLLEFSNLQIESYIREAAINREIEKIKQSVTMKVETSVLEGKLRNISVPSRSKFTIDDTNVYDYNSVNIVKNWRRNKFMNDLNVDMTPYSESFTVSAPIENTKDEIVDDSVFATNQEIFGKDFLEETEFFDTFDPIYVDKKNFVLSPRGSDDEFEVIDSLDFDGIPNKNVNSLERKEKVKMDKYAEADLNSGVPPLNFSVDAAVPHFEGEANDPILFNPEIEKKDELSCSKNYDFGENIFQAALGDEFQIADSEKLEQPQDIPKRVSQDEALKVEMHKANFEGHNCCENMAINYMDDFEDGYDYVNLQTALSRVEKRVQKLDGCNKIHQLLDLFGIPYLIAPFEAEAQCAHLNQKGICYAVITDDSDALAFGAKRVLKNFCNDKIFEVYMADRIFSRLGLGQEQLALMAVICGCDYTAGVRGIGVVNALEVIRAYPTFDDLYTFRKWATSDCDLETATFDVCPIRRAYKEAHINYRLNWSFSADFPNREAYQLFLNPMTRDVTNFSWRNPKFDEIVAFMELSSSLPKDEIQSCIDVILVKKSQQHMMEDFYPAFSSKASAIPSTKNGRSVIKGNLSAFRNMIRNFNLLYKPGNIKNNKKIRIFRDKIPIATVRSKRMQESIEGIRERALRRPSSKAFRWKT